MMVIALVINTMSYIDKVDSYLDSLKIGKSLQPKYFQGWHHLRWMSLFIKYAELYDRESKSSEQRRNKLLDLGWWYFFAKFTELLDTIFFVLRKKNKQITFLHVYHHVVMAIYSWSYLKFAAGGEGAVLALLNSIVHVVMYTYYLLSGLGPRFQKYLWWKKYVTKMQLVSTHNHIKIICLNLFP
ncbi:Elongation of very long chain fatty acids protein, partial [Operophtera brumata]